MEEGWRVGKRRERERDVDWIGLDWIVEGNLRGEMMRSGRGGER